MFYGLLIQPWRLSTNSIDEPPMENLEVNRWSAESSEAEIPGSQENIAESLEMLAIVVAGRLPVPAGAGSQCGEQSTQRHQREIENNVGQDRKRWERKGMK